MKLLSIFLLVTCLQVSATGFTQKVTLNVKDASLEEVFRSIEQQTGMSFIYGKKQIRPAHPVSLQLHNEELSIVLNQLFRDQPLTSTENMRFAASLAALGLILRNSDFKGTAKLEDVKEWARNAKTFDPNGQRTKHLAFLDKLK